MHKDIKAIQMARVQAEHRGDEVDQPIGSVSLGPLCFSRHIRTEPFPSRFRIANGINKYDGTANPDTWLADYLVACNIGRGDKGVALWSLSLDA